MRCQECKSRFFCLTLDRRTVCANCGAPVPDAPRRALDVLRFMDRAADIAAAVDRSGEDLDALYTLMDGLSGDFTTDAEAVMRARTNASTLRNEVYEIIRRLRANYLSESTSGGANDK